MQGAALMPLSPVRMPINVAPLGVVVFLDVWGGPEVVPVPKPLRMHEFSSVHLMADPFRPTFMFSEVC